MIFSAGCVGWVEKPLHTVSLANGLAWPEARESVGEGKGSGIFTRASLLPLLLARNFAAISEDLVRVLSFLWRFV
ncbi:hypothetical protein BABINDRAFT_163379, partial [Babjeviella inositovora NRRL Y-12698]